MRNSLLIVAVAAVTVFAACSGGGQMEKERKYTPLSVYFDPLLSQFHQDEPAAYYIDFINYPNDLVKHGLRGNVSDVRYHSKGDIVKTYKHYSFDNEGRLKSVSSPAHQDPARYEYDDEGRLKDVYRVYGRGWTRDHQKLEYDTVGHLVKRIDGDLAYSYLYYDNGVLKRMFAVDRTPFWAKDYTDSIVMDFYESGDLRSWKFPNSINSFVEEMNGDLPSSAVFFYTDGLCTEKLERIVWMDREEVLDTLVCHHSYAYNDKGDVITWTYNGRFYDRVDANRYAFPSTSVTIRFEYEYDEYDNWRTMRIILPKNFTEVRSLTRSYDFYSIFYKGMRPVMPTTEEDYALTVYRDIQYYAFSAEEEREMKKKNAPKFTAVQGRGLLGDVKSVKGGNYTMVFNEFGNIVRDGSNTYTYESPTRYMINSAIGPYRIVCEDNLRKEEDEKGIELGTEYEFDKRGRVVRRRYTDDMMPIEEKYTYDGREKYPSEMKCTASYEDGQDIYTCRYSYLEFDEQENWTKRKVNRTWEITTYNPVDETEETSSKTDPEFVETRTITYY